MLSSQDKKEIRATLLPFATDEARMMEAKWQVVQHYTANITCAFHAQDVVNSTYDIANDLLAEYLPSGEEMAQTPYDWEMMARDDASKGR